MDTKIIKLLRNKTVYSSLEEAKNKISTYVKSSGDLDGVVILGRYNDGTTVTTIMATVYGSGNTANITYIVNDSDSIIEQIAKVSASTKAELIGKEGDGSSASTIYGAKTYTDEKIEALNVDDSITSGSFVTAVSQSNGKVSVKRAKLQSTNKTVNVSANTDGSIDLAANIDGKTILADTSGTLSVSSDALVQYIGSNAVSVTSADTNNKKTISLGINKNDKVLSQDTNGLLATVSLLYDKETRLIKLIGKDNVLIASIDASEFIKDGMLAGETVFMASATTQSVTIKGQTNNFEKLTKGHHYIVFLFEINKGKTTEYSWDILDATDIIDVYKASDGLQLSGDGHTFFVKIDKSSEKFLTVSSEGVKLSGVTDAIETAIDAAKKSIVSSATTEYNDLAKVESKIKEVDKKASAAHTQVNAKADGHVTVTLQTKKTTDGVSYSSVTVSENDIASASGLTAEIARAKGAEDTIETSVGLAADGKHIATSGNYTSGATTVVGEIDALDKQVKKNADNIATEIARAKAVAKAAGVIDANFEIAYNAPTKSGAFSKTTSIMEMLDTVDELWNIVDGGTY